MLVSALGRFARWQVQGVHNLPDDITPTEDALVREEIKTLLSTVEDNAATRRLLVFNLGWHFSIAPKQLPVVNVAGGMPQRRAIGFRLGKRRGVDDEFAVKKPEDADAWLWSGGIVRGIAYFTFQCEPRRRLRNQHG